MKIQKAFPGKTGLKILLLAIGLSGLPQPSSANAVSGDSAPFERLQAPVSLGGVSLARYQPWQPAASYPFDMISRAYGPAVVDRACRDLTPALG